MGELLTARITDGLTLSAQPAPEDFPRLAAQGVRMIVNNRPDDEEPGQLPAAEAARIAAANGMEYRHLPVRLPAISEGDVRAFATALQEAGGPVHAHCRSGLRSATLWALNEVLSGRLSREQAELRLAAAGFDPKTANAWLDSNGPGRAA